MATRQPRQVSPTSYVAFDVVAMAASLGGLKALGRVLGALPPDFPAAVVVVQHLSPRAPSLLADILSRRTPLQVEQAMDGEVLRPATVYTAPPDRHLLVNADGSLSLTLSPKVHATWPAADLLFASVAASYKDRAIAVVLTGKLCDGARGVQKIKQMAGRVLVQAPGTAEASGMPRAAIQTGCADFILSLDKIAPALVTLVMVRGATELFLRMPRSA